MTEDERQRWTRARVYAERQGRDANMACAYADWVILGIRGGYIVTPARQEPWFITWERFTGN